MSGGLCDIFTHIESQPHFVITPHNLNNFLKNLHDSLNKYLSIITGNNEAQKATIVNMLETTKTTFSIIYKCIESETPHLTPSERNLLINLSRAIIYDTEHDFGSGSSRGNCKNDVIRSCLSSFDKLKNYNGNGDLPNLNQYAAIFFSNDRQVAGFEGITTFNSCVDPANHDSINNEAIQNLSDIKYYLQDSAVHKKAKTAFLMSGGKTIYRAISTAIDPAGCKNEKANEYNVADYVNIKYELLILNISLIFYQNFYTILENLKIFFYMNITHEDRTYFKTNKKFNINIYNFNDDSIMQIPDVIGGSNCYYSPQKICDILTTNLSHMHIILPKYYKNIPLHNDNDYFFARALQLILKGHGDFGQIFWTMFLYYTPTSKLPDNFYLNIDDNFEKFYNNCLIQTGDKYFACISAILEAPVLIGTTGNISMYIIDSNIKYYDEYVINSYNKYNDLKLYNTIEEGIVNYNEKRLSILQSEENSIESITNENAYNKYYNDNIIHFFIVKISDDKPFTLYECGINNENGNIEILYNITDFNYWKSNSSKWIKFDDRYSNAANDDNLREFNHQRSLIKDKTYYDLVNIKIFSLYSKNFIDNNLPIIISTTNEIISKLKKEKEQARGSHDGDIYIKTIPYIYYIIYNGLDRWVQHNNSSYFKQTETIDPPPPRIRSIIANNKTFENINNNLKILIKISEVIQNLLNVMYENLNLLNDHFTRIYDESYKDENDKLLFYTINIIQVYNYILKNNLLNSWIALIEPYSNEYKSIFPFENRNDNDNFKKEMVKLNNINIITPDEIIIFGFVKDFGNNISILSSSCDLIKILDKKLKNLSSKIHDKLITTLNSYHAGAGAGPVIYAKQWLRDNKFPPDPNDAKLSVDEATYSQSLDTIYEMTNPDKKECIEYCQDNEDDMTIYLIKYIDNISSLNVEFNRILSRMEIVLNMHYIAANMQIAYEEIYRRLRLILFYKDISYTLPHNFAIYLNNYINRVTEHISKTHYQNVTILMNSFINGAILLQNDKLMAYGLLTLFSLPEIKDQQHTDVSLKIIIKKIIKQMIYLEFKNNYKNLDDGAINDDKIKKLIVDDVIDDGDTTFNVDEWFAGHAGGSLYGISKNNSNKLKIYLKNIENITEKIKLLKKNKIKNKDKIKQENNNIKKLKLKIKKESKKEKEKERKQKEKEKQRKQKIIQKEKHKKEIKIEKQRKEKEKEKTKQKKQKEIEKEKEKQKKEINKNKEKEKQTKQKEKQKKEIEKEKQRKQKIIQKEKQKKEIEKQRKEKEKEKTKQKTKQKETLKTKKETKKIKIKIIKNI